MKTLLTTLLIIFSASVFSQTVVVVPKESMVNSLNAQEVANIFLARTNRFPNGEKSMPIELKDEEVRRIFYQNISGKSPKQLMAYWTTIVFTGKGRPPKGYINYEELMKRFEGGAITYLELSRVTENMKIVYIFP